MADRYWVANGATANWNTASNWNTLPDGSGSAGLPAAPDHVIFGTQEQVAANVGKAACIMNTSPTINKFTSQEAYNDITYEGTMQFTALVNTISFGGRNPNEIGFKVGMSIAISGTTSNNGTTVINTITTTSIVVSTILTNEISTGVASYSAFLDLSGNTLTFSGSGILMTLDSVIKNTSISSASIIINGGAYVGGSGNRYFLAGDNQNFENRDMINMQFNTSISPMYFDDGVYPLVQLASGVSATTSYVAPTSNVHGASKFYQISFDNTWLASTGTVRDNLKKKFQVDNTDTIAIRSTLFDTGYSTWTFDTTTTMVIPTDGELIYGTGNIFNVRWYNLIIKNSGNANRLATIGYRRNLDVNSLTVEVGATLRGYATQSIDGAAGGTATISSTTRPNIKGAWNFKQVADGIYSSILDEAYTITPSHGTAGKMQFSFGGGAFFSHSKMQIILDDYQNWEGTTNPILQVCDGAFMKSSFFAFCQSFAAASGSGENSSIWESNGSPSVLYYTDSAGTHHNLLAGGGGGGGATAFTGLSDTPANYVGSANKQVRVNALESGLEFFTPTPIVSIFDEGTLLGTPTKIDFTGAGVTASFAGTTATVNIPASGGGGGGGYPLFKHDELPVENGFSPFRLLANGDTIEIGVSAGATDNKDVSVFTPADNEIGSSVITATHIGSVASNTGREYLFYGQGRRGSTTKYKAQSSSGGGGFPQPIFVFINSMRELSGFFPPVNDTLTIVNNSEGGINNVRVVDAGEHLFPFEDTTFTIRALLITGFNYCGQLPVRTSEGEEMFCNYSLDRS